MTAFFFFNFLPYFDDETPGDGGLDKSFVVNSWSESFVLLFLFFFDVFFLRLQSATSALRIQMIKNMIAIFHNLIDLFK